MYQFYYAEKPLGWKRRECRDDVRNHFIIEAVRPAMWEEHCLECSAPACYGNCVYYQERSDGRCKRFENGLFTFKEEKACCGQGAHVTFRQWADMMTIVFPAMLKSEGYTALFLKNQKKGRQLEKIAKGPLPQKIRWESIRTVEYLRRRGLRKLEGLDNVPDAFLFHGYSYNKESYHLILEVYDDEIPLYKTSLPIAEGENLFVIDREQLSPDCWKANNLIKIYPENNIRADLDLLWCDFVKGRPVESERPAGSIKCVVWDLDDTLWDGILIESDPDELRPRSFVVETIKALDERGILQSIASKNEYEQAWPVLERLGLSNYFLYPQISWGAKSGAIKQIARLLNIGEDTLALIDDSAFERKQVQSVLPQVRTYDGAHPEKLLAFPEFNVMVTKESKSRRKMYQAQAKRNEILSEEKDGLLSFLRKSNLRIRVFRPETEEEILRCYELVVRTNQLNMSGKKYGEAEFRQVLDKEESTNFSIECRDDFGEYGIVGYGQYKKEEGQLVFTEFALSCRVAGKYVESALFHALLMHENLPIGIFPVQITKKNELLRRTLQNIGFCLIQKDQKELKYQFHADLTCYDLVKVDMDLK